MLRVYVPRQVCVRTTLDGWRCCDRPQAGTASSLVQQNSSGRAQTYVPLEAREVHAVLLQQAPAASTGSAQGGVRALHCVGAHITGFISCICRFLPVTTMAVQSRLSWGVEGSCLFIRVYGTQQQYAPIMPVWG